MRVDRCLGSHRAQSWARGTVWWRLCLQDEVRTSQGTFLSRYQDDVVANIGETAGGSLPNVSLFHSLQDGIAWSASSACEAGLLVCSASDCTANGAAAIGTLCLEHQHARVFACNCKVPAAMA